MLESLQGFILIPNGLEHFASYLKFKQHYQYLLLWQDLTHGRKQRALITTMHLIVRKYLVDDAPRLVQVDDKLRSKLPAFMETKSGDNALDESGVTWAKLQPLYEVVKSCLEAEFELFKASDEYQDFRFNLKNLSNFLQTAIDVI